MSNLLIRGTTVEEVLSYCSTAGQRMIEATLEADWSEPVCPEMGWTVEPEGFGNGSLDGKLNGINMILEPNKKDLKDARFDIAISTVGTFKHKATVKDGAVVDRKLRFKITTVAEDAHLVFNNWLTQVGPSDSKAQCRIIYNAEEQMTMDAPPAEAVPSEVTEERPRGRKMKLADARVQ